MIDDVQLLRRYAQDQSEAAFAELVQRHLGWIYRTALRRTGGRSDLAQDVSQYVFIALAKQAAALAEREQLAGWFYTTIRNAAYQLMRAEARRRVHESAAAMTLYDDLQSDNGVNLRPALDQELDRLSAKDREALLLRYFAGKNFSEIGLALNIGEDGARKRVERALDRLGAQFNRRGIASTLAVVSGLLTAEGASRAAPEIHSLVIHTALSGVAPAGSSAALIQLMSITKLSWASLALCGLAGVMALSTATVAWHEITGARSASAALEAAQSRYQLNQQSLRAAEAAAASAASVAKHPMVRSTKGESAEPASLAMKQSAALAAKQTAAAKSKQGKAEMQNFLGQYSQAKDLLMRVGRAQVIARDALFFRQAGLSATQTEQLLNQTASQWQDSAILVPNEMHLTETDLSDAQLRAILNDDQFQAYKETERGRPAMAWVGALAQSSAEGGVPMSIDQVEALRQAVVSNSPEYASGAAVNPANVNWDNVVIQAQHEMTPQQWAQVQPTIQMQQVQRQLNAAAAAESSQP